MAIATLSSAFMPYGRGADAGRVRGAAAPTPVPAAAACTHETREGPRRTPLLRALMDALGSMVEAAPPSTAPITTDAAPAPAATATSADATSSDLDDALMNFAHALMQALRGARSGDGDSDGEQHGHGHHGLHHDFGRRAWGDPAQRVAQLAAQSGAAAPASAAAVNTPSVPPAPSTAQAATVGDTVLDPAAATSFAAAAGTSAPAWVVHIDISGTSPWARPLQRLQQSLLDAFGALQQARGVAAADSGNSLSSQLTAFLQALAERLRSDAADAADAARPGALVDVMA